MTNNDMTPTIALSSLKKGDSFRIDDPKQGPPLTFYSIDYPEQGSEAIIRFTDPRDPRHIYVRHLIQVNDFAFYSA